MSWWRLDEICETFQQDSHVTKVWKFNNNLQAQNVDAEIEEVQLFKIATSKAKEVC